MNEEAARAHVAFAESEAAKLPDLPPDTPLRPLRSAAVVGAGTMGGGIAMALANAGIPVVLIDAAQAALDTGRQRITDNYAFTVAKGRLAQAEMDARLSRIGGSTDLAAAADADIVIEAVFEDLDLKRELFGKLDALARPGAILGTNTSALDIDAIAAATKRPQDVVGAHFFAPANVMRLLEVVRARETAPDAVAALMALGRTMGKVAVQARVYPGFIGNAMFAHTVREALFAIEEGALPQQVDRALTGFGYAMGVCAVLDLSGNDVGIQQRRKELATRPTDRRHADFMTVLCDTGRLGQKTGRGWYRYERGSRAPLPDPDAEALIVEHSRRLGIARRTVPDSEIVERCVYSMVNEAARLLEHGVALRPSDIDIVAVTGYGFPAARGGPLFHADSVGLPRVLDAIERFHATHGYWWQPAPLLQQLVRDGRRFADLQVKETA